MSMTVSGSAVLLLAAAVLVPLPPAHAAQTRDCQGVAATIVGTPSPDRLVGTPGPDVIVARGGDDLVHGRGGDDLICGGPGADTLRGGTGDDRLHGQRDSWSADRAGASFEGDLLDGGPGDDLLDIGDDNRAVTDGSHGILDYQRARSAVTVDLAAGTATGQGSDTLVLATLPCDGFSVYCYDTEVLGSAYDDTLLGSDAEDHLVGNAGNDLIDGRGGADLLAPDPSPRTPAAQAPAGDDVVTGGPGDDFLHARNGRDQLFGDAGDDQVWALEGGPFELYGGSGDDWLVAVFSSEPGFVIDGGPGLDAGQFERSRNPDSEPPPTSATVTMSDGSVVADGTEWGRVLAIEELRLGGPSNWEYLGTDAPETVRAAGPSLQATTYGGNDTIVGSTGSDRIDAGDGVDSVYGAEGRDTCLNAEQVHSCEVVSP